MDLETRKRWAARWPHFSPHEVLSAKQLALFIEKGVFPYAFRALDLLHEFREFVGQPLICNNDLLNRRGARSIKEVYEINSLTRGEDRKWEYSFHLWCAFDLSSPKMDTSELYGYALRFKKWKGIGHYDTFVHVDCRDSFNDFPILWDSRSR